MGRDVESSQRNRIFVGVLADVTNIRGQTREKTEKGSGTEAGSGKEVALRDTGIDASNKAAISFDAREKHRWRVRHQHAKVFKIQVMIVQSAYFISISQDIDIAHSDDPHMCVQYVNDIYSHLRESEEHQKPDPAYMRESSERHKAPTIKGILVDWLVEVAEEYKLSSETLYLSVCYIDRCLSAHQVARTQLQVRHLCRGTLSPFHVRTNTSESLHDRIQLVGVTLYAHRFEIRRNIRTAS